MASLDLLLAWDSRDLLKQGHQDFTIFYSVARIVRQGRTRAALLGPILLFLPPLHLLLAFYKQRYSVMALVLLFWLGAVAWEIAGERATFLKRP